MGLDEYGMFIQSLVVWNRGDDLEDRNQKRMAENYEITQAVYIGDKEVVMGRADTFPQ